MIDKQMTESAGACLNLVVLNSANLGAAVAFYKALGLTLVSERHGNGPEHFAAVSDGGLVFELYPASDTRPVSKIRLGFSVASIDRLLKSIEEISGEVAVPPKSGQWGLRATLVDPDGNKVDIAQRDSTRAD